MFWLKLREKNTTDRTVWTFKERIFNLFLYLHVMEVRSEECFQNCRSLRTIFALRVQKEKKNRLGISIVMIFWFLRGQVFLGLLLLR